MYQDYLDAIVRHYEEKKVSNDLPLRLQNPTPAKIKDECLAVYQKGLVKKDLIILTTFLEVQEDADVLKLIKRGRDRFKPLNNFLRAGTEKPEDRHIELLGWLLNFEPRPFIVGHDYEQNKIAIPQEIIPVTGEPEGKGSPEPTPKPTVRNPMSEELGPGEPQRLFLIGSFIRNIYSWMGKRRLELRVGGIAVLGVIASLYFNNKGMEVGNVIPDNRQCMVWTGNNYERISCDSPGISGLILPLDEDRLKNLHRITMPKTLTEQHIGKVWYRKRTRDSLDFYTAGGTDPVDPNVDLKRMSVYIFNEHVRKKKSPDFSNAQ